MVYDGKSMKKNAQKGGVVAYLQIMIFLIGLVAVALTQGSKRNATTQQIDELTAYMQSDIETLRNAISECVVTYNDPADIDDNGTIDSDDNPNAPFPLYDDLSSGAAGEDLFDIRCPGAPASNQPIFNNDAGRTFKLLQDSTLWSVNYLNDSTEGVLVRITRTASDAAWDEAASRINDHYSACEVAAETDGGDCANGCIYYWILRRATSVTATESGACP
jgi:hypothetical protein